MMTVKECIKYVEEHLEVRYATENGAYKANRKIADPSGAVNHSVGCAQPAVDVFFNNMNKSSAGWGVNALLGDFHKGEGRIILVLKDNTRPWGCGSGKNGSWNNTKIQWEVCEPAGHTYAGGTMIAYDVTKNTEYFNRMWKMLVAWNVYCIKKYGYDISGISDHAEAYRAGYGSNHSDMGQWLPKHGKSMDALRAEVRAILNTKESGMQATEFKNMSEADIIAKVGPLFTEDQKKSGVLASVSLAQFILESGYGKSELAQNANNCFGMKKSLSGNTWGGSAWDGTSIYTKQTKEQNKDGSYETITADFRKYTCVEDSISDHSAYLLGAMNGDKKRYEGLKGMTDYRAALQLIKDGGYATSLTYVDKLCGIVEKWNLTQYDAEAEKEESTVDTITDFPAVPFTVKVIVDDLNYRSEPSMNGKVNGQTGKGIFTIIKVENGWGFLKSKVGWIWLGNPSYCTVLDTVKEEKQEETFKPYTVQVKITNLNIRKGPGTDYDTNGQTGKGVFTIIEERKGKGSDNGWGLLKSKAGWISLDFVTKL